MKQKSLTVYSFALLATIIFCVGLMDIVDLAQPTILESREKNQFILLSQIVPQAVKKPVIPQKVSLSELVAPLLQTPTKPLLPVSAAAATSALPTPAPPVPVAAVAPLEPQPAESHDTQAKYRLVTALVTAYCPCRVCCGRLSPGRTSIGKSAWVPGIAADPRAIPYGTRVEVPGYGNYKIDDTGGAMRRSWRRGRLHLDIRMKYHYTARRWGRRYLKVKIFE